ncbi:DUF2817 domain-containing protein [Shewanella sedimentimangrovi]|uniref:DUF2817 domain-containing protein n=1 Tax=Shewanella sedimentimangrovi TaxID=2814293 RepID=A0ABX7R4C3_9GAMM|nr:DUF2817 domain-containing protein [Shewanella sedimentimangrovi]QSX38643.1 DUF2817 domain-containing protein [Shewanella sedimentimangrovi]
MFAAGYELAQLERLIQTQGQRLRAQILVQLPGPASPLPLHAIELGTDKPGLPTVLFVGGVHGLERIGTQILLTFLGSLMQRLGWDPHLQAMLSGLRLAFVPLVNPQGMAMGRRANANGVDLMRNAPLEGDRVTPWVGGQRLSARLPWFRGHGGLETETRALTDYCRELRNKSSLLLVLDAHSGFGLEDHLWFPYACHHRPGREIARIFRFWQLFEDSYSHHCHYHCGPQSAVYRTHGDIWDWLSQDDSPVPLLPFTLEMGSWAWVRKNPRQLFNFAGLFNPQKQHRHHRILRRHTILMQFMLELAHSRLLEQLSPAQLTGFREQGVKLWYPELLP